MKDGPSGKPHESRRFTEVQLHQLTSAAVAGYAVMRVDKVNTQARASTETSVLGTVSDHPAYESAGCSRRHLQLERCGYV
jgi:hypothetical protein